MLCFKDGSAAAISRSRAAVTSILAIPRTMIPIQPRSHLAMNATRGLRGAHQKPQLCRRWLPHTMGGRRALVLRSAAEASYMPFPTEWTGGAANISVAVGGAAFRSHTKTPPNPTSRQKVRLRFSVPTFRTQPGQQLVVVGACTALGDWQPSRGFHLTWQEGHRWTGEVEANVADVQGKEFKVVMVDHSTGSVMWEQGRNRVLKVDTSQVQDVCCEWGKDTSRKQSRTSVCRTHVFGTTTVAERDSALAASPHPAPRGLRAQVQLVVPLYVGAAGQRLVVVGSLPELGAWDVSLGVELCCSSSPDYIWRGDVELPLEKMMEAKLVVLGADHHTPLWESGTNRSITLMPPPEEDFLPSQGTQPTGVAGHYVVLCHWGITGCSQTMYRPNVTVLDENQSQGKETQAGGVDPGERTLPSSTAAANLTDREVLSLVHFTVPQFLTAPGQHLVLVGSLPSLGGWNPSNGVQFKWSPGHCWNAEMRLPANEDFEAKVVYYDNGRSSWETGPNRVLKLTEVLAGSSPGSEPMFTCYWGHTPTTPVVVVPKRHPRDLPPELQVVEPEVLQDTAASHSRPLPKGSSQQPGDVAAEGDPLLRFLAFMLSLFMEDKVADASRPFGLNAFGGYALSSPFEDGDGGKGEQPLVMVLLGDEDEKEEEQEGAAPVASTGSTGTRASGSGVSAETAKARLEATMRKLRTAKFDVRRLSWELREATRSLEARLEDLTHASKAGARTAVSLLTRGPPSPGSGPPTAQAMLSKAAPAGGAGAGTCNPDLTPTSDLPKIGVPALTAAVAALAGLVSAAELRHLRSLLRLHQWAAAEYQVRSLQPFSGIVEAKREMLPAELAVAVLEALRTQLARIFVGGGPAVVAAMMSAASAADAAAATKRITSHPVDKVRIVARTGATEPPEGPSKAGLDAWLLDREFELQGLEQDLATEWAAVERTRAASRTFTLKHARIFSEPNDDGLPNEQAQVAAHHDILGLVAHTALLDEQLAAAVRSYDTALHTANQQVVDVWEVALAVAQQNAKSRGTELRAAYQEEVAELAACEVELMCALKASVQRVLVDRSVAEVELSRVKELLAAQLPGIREDGVSLETFRVEMEGVQQQLRVAVASAAAELEGSRSRSGTRLAAQQQRLVRELKDCSRALRAAVAAAIKARQEFDESRGAGPWKISAAPAVDATSTATEGALRHDAVLQRLLHLQEGMPVWDAVLAEEYVALTHLDIKLTGAAAVLQGPRAAQTEEGREVDTLRLSLATLEASHVGEAAALERMASHQTAERAALGQAAAELRRKVDALRKELRRSQKRYSLLAGDHSRLTATAAASEALAAELEGRLKAEEARREEELWDVRSQYDTALASGLAAEREDAAKVLSVVRAEQDALVSDLRSQLADTRTLLQQQLEDIRSRDQDLAAAAAALRSLQERLRAAETDAASASEEFRQQLAAAAAKLGAERAGFEEQLAEQKAAVEVAAAAKVQDLEARLAAVRDEQMAAAAQHESQQQVDLAAHRLQLEDLMEGYSREQSKREELFREQLQDLALQLDVVRVAARESEARGKQAQKLMAEDQAVLKEQLADAVAQVAASRTTEAELQRELVAAQAAHSEDTARAAGHHAEQLTALRDEHAREMQSSREAAAASLAEARATADAAETALRAELHAVMAEADARIAEQQTRLQEAQINAEANLRAKEAELAEAQNMGAAAAATAADLEAKLSASLDAKTYLEKIMGVAKDQHTAREEELNSKIREMLGRTSKLAKDLDEAGRAMKALQEHLDSAKLRETKSLAEASLLQQRLATEQALVDSLKTQLEWTRRDANSEAAAAEREKRQELTAQRARMQGAHDEEMDELRQQLLDLQRLMKSLGVEVQGKAVEIQKLVFDKTSQMDSVNEPRSGPSRSESPPAATAVNPSETAGSSTVDQELLSGSTPAASGTPPQGVERTQQYLAGVQDRKPSYGTLSIPPPTQPAVAANNVVPSPRLKNASSTGGADIRCAGGGSNATTRTGSPGSSGTTPTASGGELLTVATSAALTPRASNFAVLAAEIHSATGQLQQLAPVARTENIRKVSEQDGHQPSHTLPPPSQISMVAESAGSIAAAAATTVAILADQDDIRLTNDGSQVAETKGAQSATPPVASGFTQVNDNNAVLGAAQVPSQPQAAEAANQERCAAPQVTVVGSPDAAAAADSDTAASKRASKSSAGKKHKGGDRLLWLKLFSLPWTRR